MKTRSLILAMLATSLAVALLPNSFGRAKPITLGNAAVAPQQSFKNRYGIEMVYIPPGEFVMGARHPAHGRVQANNTEEPVHHVTIAYGFYISRYEITQRQWQAVMGNNPSYFKGQSLPVEGVSFTSGIRLQTF